MVRRTFPFERSIPHDADLREVPAGALTIDELEAGLRQLQRIGTDRRDFWAANGAAFHETVKVAIRETSEALLLHEMSATLRAELEGQLALLLVYLTPRPHTLN